MSRVPQPISHVSSAAFAQARLPFGSEAGWCVGIGEATLTAYWICLNQTYQGLYTEQSVVFFGS
jgi:hypothetical protein